MRSASLALALGLLLAAAVPARAPALPPPTARLRSLRAAAQTDSCSLALQGLCGGYKSEVFECAECAGSHQVMLEHSGCTNQEISAWCAGAPPPPPPVSTLKQERVLIVTRHGIRVPFAPVEHQPATIFSKDPSRNWFAEPAAWGATKIAELTPHGKTVITLMGSHMAETVLPPKPYNFTVYADLDHTRRDIQTAEAFMKGALHEPYYHIDPWSENHPEVSALLLLSQQSTLFHFLEFL